MTLYSQIGVWIWFSNFLLHTNYLFSPLPLFLFRIPHLGRGSAQWLTVNFYVIIKLNNQNLKESRGTRKFPYWADIAEKVQVQFVVSGRDSTGSMYRCNLLYRKHEKYIIICFQENRIRSFDSSTLYPRNIVLFFFFLFFSFWFEDD